MECTHAGIRWIKLNDISHKGLLHNKFKRQIFYREFNAYTVAISSLCAGLPTRL